MSRALRKEKGVFLAGWRGRVAVASLVLILLAVGGGYVTLRSYLHSDGFRKFLSLKVSRAVGVRGEFSAFRWSGLTVETASFAAEGEGEIRVLKAEGLQAEIGLGGVPRGVWELDGVSVRRLDVVLDATEERPGEDAPPEVAVEEEKKARPRRWYPNEVELTSLDLREVNVRAILRRGDFLAERLAVRLEGEKGGGEYRGEISNGRLIFPGKHVPRIDIDRLAGSYGKGVLTVSSAEASVWDGGWLSAKGQWDVKEKTCAFEGRVTGVEMGEVFDESWARRIEGKGETDFFVEGGEGEVTVRGTLTMKGGRLTALPVLDALAAYADTRRFREVSLDEASASWQWSRDELLISGIALESEGLMRIEGEVAVRGDELDGEFRIGIVPGVLSVIPGAERLVFLPGEKGLLWATCRLGGTVDDPKEDLSDRLIAAAGLRMIERLPEGSKLRKASGKLLGESPEDVLKNLEKAEDVVRDAKKLLKENRGIFKDLLRGGSGKRKDDE